MTAGEPLPATGAGGQYGAVAPATGNDQPRLALSSQSPAAVKCTAIRSAWAGTVQVPSQRAPETFASATAVVAAKEPPWKTTQAVTDPAPASGPMSAS